jgi:hypothetical protein
MAALTDATILAMFRYALMEWGCAGYITWKPVAREWVERNLDGYTTRAVGEEMFRFFQSGGIIDQVRETRPEWSEYRFHYDFRLPIAGQMIYIETVLIDRDPTDPTIHVVSIHGA